MNETYSLLRHFLAALAYRTQKALRGAPDDFADSTAGEGTRSPRELVRHMTNLLGYSRTQFVGGVYRAEPLPEMAAEVERFHALLADVATHLAAETPLREITPEQLLQGPFADAMTHVGQLAMLRRLAGAPVASENFILAAISADRLGSDQPEPAAPASAWMGKLIHWGWRLSRWLNRS